MSTTKMRLSLKLMMPILLDDDCASKNSDSNGFEYGSISIATNCTLEASTDLSFLWLDEQVPEDTGEKPQECKQQ